MLLRIKVNIAGLVLVAAGTPAAVLAQANADPAAATHRRLVERVDTVRMTAGPLAEELVEPLDELAQFYEADGDAALALVTTDQAMQIVRTNFGLYSLEQVPLLTRLIRYAEERGDLARAWELEQDLHKIATRNADDLRSVPLARDIADRRIDMLERYINGELLPQIIFGCYYTVERNYTHRDCSAGKKDIAAAAILNEAQSLYEQAVDTLVAHGMLQSPELRASEMDLVRTSYLYGRYLVRTNYLFVRQLYVRAEREERFPCQRAVDSLTRLHTYDELNDEPAAVRAESLVRVADFELYCGQNAAALNGYRAALALLTEADVPQARIDQLFAPEKPIDLPAFADSALDVEESDTDAAFAEVSFELSKFGMAQNVKVLSGKGQPGADAIVSRIRQGRFRPYAKDGEIVGSPRLVVRYFLEEE